MKFFGLLVHDRKTASHFEECFYETHHLAPLHDFQRGDHCGARLGSAERGHRNTGREQGRRRYGPFKHAGPVPVLVLPLTCTA